MKRTVSFISLILVMFVLPQLLLAGCRIVDRTSFSVSVAVAAQTLGLIGGKEDEPDDEE